MYFLYLQKIKKVSIRKFSSYYGAILGSILLFVGLLFHLSGVLVCEKAILEFSINTCIMSVILFYVIRIYKDNFNNGFMGYQDCIKIGISVGVFSAIIFGFWKVLFTYFMNPDFNSLCVDFAQQKIIDMKDYLGDDTVDNMLADLEKQRQQVSTHLIVLNEILKKAIGSFLLSSIIYFFVRKKEADLNSI